MAGLNNFYTRVVSAVVLLTLFVGFFFLPPLWRLTALLFLMFSLWIEATTVYLRSERRRSLKGRLVLGAAIGVSGVAFLGMGALSNSIPAFLYLCGIVIVTDSAAYIGGNLMGGPKLARKISPNKTWSGFGAGCLAAVVFACCVHLFVPFDPKILGFFSGSLDMAFLGVAVVVSVLSQTGDLLESAAKRFLGVKDSGTLIPGHGGLWDRLDGYLFVFAPVGLFMVSSALLAMYWAISAGPNAPCPFGCDDLPTLEKPHQIR